MPEMEKTVRGRTALGKESQGRKREKAKSSHRSYYKSTGRSKADSSGSGKSGGRSPKSADGHAERKRQGACKGGSRHTFPLPAAGAERAERTEKR